MPLADNEEAGGSNPPASTIAGSAGCASGSHKPVLRVRLPTLQPLPHRLTVGQLPLKQPMLVRIQRGQPHRRTSGGGNIRSVGRRSCVGNDGIRPLLGGGTYARIARTRPLGGPTRRAGQGEPIGLPRSVAVAGEAACDRVVFVMQTLTGALSTTRGGCRDLLLNPLRGLHAGIMHRQYIALLAQRNGANGYEPLGRGFESLRARQINDTDKA